MSKPRTLLAVFAHPDDEAFGPGGTLAKYAREGTRVILVCATRGEAGEISDPNLASPETLGEVREQELWCAARVLGIADVIFLGYRDSGMAGSPNNAHPQAFVNAPQEEVVPRLVGIMRQVRPDIVITFEPNGGYGHPDHIAIHQHTVAAFHAAGLSNHYPEQGEPWQPRRLFYTAIPRSFFRRLRQILQDAGIETRNLDHWEKTGMGWPDEAVNVILDVSAVVDIKWQAIQCHRTQLGPGNFFIKLSASQRRALMSHEYFALAWPTDAPGLPWNDLFAFWPEE